MEFLLQWNSRNIQGSKVVITHRSLCRFLRMLLGEPCSKPDPAGSSEGVTLELRPEEWARAGCRRAARGLCRKRRVCPEARRTQLAHGPGLCLLVQCSRSQLTVFLPFLLHIVFLSIAPFPLKPFSGFKIFTLESFQWYHRAEWSPCFPLLLCERIPVCLPFVSTSCLLARRTPASWLPHFILHHQSSLVQSCECLFSHNPIYFLCSTYHDLESPDLFVCCISLYILIA